MKSFLRSSTSPLCQTAYESIPSQVNMIELTQDRPIFIFLLTQFKISGNTRSHRSGALISHLSWVRKVQQDPRELPRGLLPDSFPELSDRCRESKEEFPSWQKSMTLPRPSAEEGNRSRT
jgi:hypothetical protein